MAKRGTLEHPKNRRLARALKIPPIFSLGILEGLWHYTSANHPTGRHSRQSLESAFRSGELTDVFTVDELISALISTQWLDEHTADVYQIYDWRDHWWNDNRFGYSKKAYWLKMKAAGGTISHELRTVIFKRDGYQCLCCGSTTDLTLDHIIPLNLGGKHKGNLQTLCRSCNSRKKDKLEKLTLCEVS